MGVLILNPSGADSVRGRVERISPASVRLWGTMDAPRMLAHLTRSIEVSLGEYPARDESNFFTRTVMRWVAFHLMRRWPRGRLKSPDYFTPPATAGGLDAERSRFLAALDRFMAAAESEPGRRGFSPLFGSHPLGYWRRIHGMHIDHHLCQFGV